MLRSADMFEEKKSPPTTAELRCSFCNKTEKQGRKVIAGPNVQICDECVDFCVDILREDRRDAPAEEWPGAVRCMICRIPAPLEDVVMVRGRGPICRSCIGEIQAAVIHERADS